jgi:hypothetical protein
MKQIAVIGFKKMESFCYWAKYKMGFELENREHRNVWIYKQEQIRYIGIFDEKDLIGRHFDHYVEVDEVRLELYKRIKIKPQTNFDKITQNEEALAEFLSYDWCPKGYKIICESKDCKECIKEWLQKESE